MRMRTTVLALGAVGTLAGIYAVDQLRLDTCLAWSFRECLSLSTLSGIMLHILPFTAMGLVAGVLLTPVFLTDADEEEHKLKWKLRELRRLKAKQLSKEVDAEIASLSQRANP